MEWVAIPSPGDLPDPGTEPMSPALGGRFFSTEPPGKPMNVPSTALSLSIYISMEREDIYIKVISDDLSFIYFCPEKYGI